MKKQEKHIYGRSLFELFKIIDMKIQNMQDEINKIAENSYYFYNARQDTLSQMEGVIDVIMKLDKYRALRMRLKKATKAVLNNYRELLISLAHPNYLIREKYIKKVSSKFKFRMSYYRYLDKMYDCFFDNFFDGIWNVEYFLKYFGDDFIVKNALRDIEIIKNNNMKGNIRIKGQKTIINDEFLNKNISEKTKKKCDLLIESITH